MSMSQEEIEALMNGLDLEEGSSEESTEETNEGTLSSDEVEKLVSQNEDNSQNSEEEEFDIDSLVNELSLADDNVDELPSNEELDIDNLDIENEELSLSSSVENNDLEDLVDVVNEIETSDTGVEKVLEEEKDNKSDLDSDFQSWADSKINEGKIPIPAESDAKVVNQLTQVANDSEEKVSQIFDVLSSTLDKNNDIRNKLNHTSEVLNAQKKLLDTLSTKFPNINIFENHLAEINTLDSDISEITNSLYDDDNQIFQAMELMQFNDINRQKIERVMSVIRKLSLYLNNLFEDEYETKDIVVAKHIHGDNTETVSGEDLEKLIDDFNSKL